VSKTITITLQDLPDVTEWLVNITDLNVTVKYKIRTTSGDVYTEGTEMFWVTVPQPQPDPGSGQPRPVPTNWEQLPPKYVQILSDLTNDLKAALAAKYLT
jgi:hypothetical protein